MLWKLQFSDQFRCMFICPKTEQRERLLISSKVVRTFH